MVSLSRTGPPAKLALETVFGKSVVPSSRRGWLGSNEVSPQTPGFPGARWRSTPATPGLSGRTWDYCKWGFPHPVAVTLEQVMADDTSHLTECLQAAGGGTQQQLAELLAECRGRLRRMVEVRLDRRLQGRIDPSDVIQEALLEASLRLPDYLRNPSMPLFLWLRFITRQTLLVLHRRHLGTQARDASREVSLYGGRLPEASSAVLVNQLLGRSSTPSQAAQRGERKTRVEEALGSMETIDREVLLLRHFEELTNSETAVALGISPTAANNRYVRALKRLRRILLSMPGGGESVRP
jgi:RNA polymerase sigma-70 factor (ECF subfamily)